MENQWVFRKMQSTGLKSKYESHQNFAQLLKTLPALAFVPLNDVLHGFVILTKQLKIPDETQDILDYFEDIIELQEDLTCFP